MADLVGRTISATGGRGGGSSTRPGRGPGGPGNSASSNPNDAARLYSLVETAMMNMPSANSSGELRPTEEARMNDLLDRTWSSMRDWLSSHPGKGERREAARHRGQFGAAALHMACKLKDPPADVVRMLVEADGDTVAWADNNGWLPLHHACANSASGKVICMLVQSFPEGKVAQDKRLRTPLHFAFFRKDDGGEAEEKDDDDEDGEEDGLEYDVGNSMAEIVALLADSGACEMQDEGGMLPIHYAGAYGTTREVLEILLENYPECITKRENKGRNSIHLAMVNAHRNSSPNVVGFLLEKNPEDLVNSYDDDHHLPIHLLAMASKFPPEKVAERKNAADCLELYLNAKPKASPDFLTAVQTLPEWLRDIAVINDHVQDILNHKIVQRFPTMILILDAFFLILVIVMFELASGQTIDHLFTKDIEDSDVEPAPKANLGYIFAMFTAGSYFFMRELVQIISLAALGNLGSWLTDMENWLDASLTFLIFYFGIIMLTSKPLISKEVFRDGAAIAKGIMWGAVIGFLKSTRVEFSVFVSGVFHVVKNLAAFLMALAVIVLMSAQFYYILYSETDTCLCNELFPDANPFPHCTFMDSLFKIYLMMMGEIGNANRYQDVPVAMIFYFLFALLVMILLSNVLIAIVTDSYGVIKDERADMVFWANRLDFVAEMDAIKNVGKKIFPCIRKKEPATMQIGPDGVPMAVEKGEKPSVARFRNGWKSIMNLFDPELYETYDVSTSSLEFWCYVLVRFVAVVFVIPVWLFVGLCSGGLLWPPQVREYLLKQKKVAAGRDDVAEQVTEKIEVLKVEIKKMHVDLKGEIKSGRKEFVQVKAEVEAVQKEVMADLLQVKEIMVTLLDMSRDHLDTKSSLT